MTPPDDSGFALTLRDLTNKVSEQATLLAILADRRGDAAQADLAIHARIDLIAQRLDTIDKAVTANASEIAQGKTRTSTIIAMLAGSGAAGAGIVKLLGLA